MEKGPSREVLLSEYAVVESKWRFLQSLRYVTMAFIGTSHAALLSLYQITLTRVQDPEIPDGLGKVGLFGICAFALVVLFAVFLLAERLRYLYSECSNRGMKIEVELGIHEGIFNALSITPHRLQRITHTHGFHLAFVVDGGAWISLVLLSWLS